MKELAFSNEEDRKNQDRMSELATKLQVQSIVDLVSHIQSRSWIPTHMVLLLLCQTGGINNMKNVGEEGGGG